jgi:hypothetical protein
MEDFAALTQNVFALINIFVGDAPIEARPYEWDDPNEPKVALAYRTTCPHCSQLIEFKVVDLRDGMIFCAECKKGKAEWELKNNQYLWELSHPVVPLEQIPAMPHLKELLLEPIAAGLMEAP